MRRLQTMPGVGPITAMAIETFAPPMAVFRRGRDFAAWLGLVPRQHSTGGKPLLGKTSKMGQRDIRRLLIIGAMAVVRLASRKGGPEGSWLHRLLAGKPRMLLAVALANKMARAIWAMLTRARIIGFLQLQCGSTIGLCSRGNVGRVRRSTNGKGK